MSGPHIDTDRIGEPADGTAWTNAELAHLAACADCRFERELIGAARRLGTAQLAGFDPIRVVAGLRHRLDSEPASAPARAFRHPARWLAGLAAAAILAVAVLTGLPRDRPVVPVVVSVLHELDGLSEPQLEQVLRSIPPASEEFDHDEMAPLADLDEDDLEQVLRSLEEP